MQHYTHTHTHRNSISKKAKTHRQLHVVYEKPKRGRNHLKRRTPYKKLNVCVVNGHFLGFAPANKEVRGGTVS